jgi:hypothetical protein
VQPLLDSFTPRPLRGMPWTMPRFCGGVLLISCVNVLIFTVLATPGAAVFSGLISD